MYAPRTQGVGEGARHWIAAPPRGPKTRAELEEPYYELNLYKSMAEGMMVAGVTKKRDRYMRDYRTFGPTRYKKYHTDSRVLKAWHFTATPEAFEETHDAIITYLTELVTAQDDKQAVIRLAKEKGYSIG